MADVKEYGADVGTACLCRAPNLARDADHIIVPEDWKIAEAGHHDLLIRE